MKKGIALFITIGILSLISLIVMNSFSLIDRGFRHISKVERINQTRVVISDVENILKIITKHIKDSDTLVAFLGAYPPIADEDGRFLLSMELNSIQRAININSIIDRNVSDGEVMELKPKYFPLFNYIFNQYQIKDGELLLNYILDTLDSDIVERDVGTEIWLNRYNFVNGKIMDIDQFREILRAYQNRVDDREVMKVPWEEFFSFSSSDKETIIDCNFMSRYLANGLELTIDETFSDIDSEEGTISDYITCDMIESSENDTEKEIYHIKPYDGNSSYLIEGVISYSTNAVSEKFRLIYDLKSKKITSIELE